MQGTITRSGISSFPDRPVVKEIPPVPTKPAAKKNNQIDVLVHLDGASYALSFQVPMSGQLLSGQKNMGYMKEAFSKMLSDKFGKATPI